MAIRKFLLIAFFAILFLHSIIAQTTDEPSDAPIFTSLQTPENITSVSSTTTPTTPTTSTTAITPAPVCNYPEEFPLFSDDMCISRSAYTAIFLTSIILAGISFLMLIGLLILCWIRQSGSSDSSYDSDDESHNSNDSIGKKSNLSESRSVGRGGGQRPAVLQRVTGATPLEDNSRKFTGQRPTEAYYSPADNQVPGSSLSAPYTVPASAPKQPTSRQQRPADQNPGESIEMTPRQPNRSTNNPPRTQPSATRKTTSREDGRSGKNRSNTTVRPDEDEEEEETQISSF